MKFSHTSGLTVIITTGFAKYTILVCQNLDCSIVLQHSDARHTSDSPCLLSGKYSVPASSIPASRREAT